MDILTKQCKRCGKVREIYEFPVTKRGTQSQRCQDCLDYVRLPTTCKRCLKTFPLEEFRIGHQGKPITYCSRCSRIYLASQRKHIRRIEETNKFSIADGSKICPRCRATKALDEFKNSRGFVCRMCSGCRLYLKNHTDKRRAEFDEEDKAKWAAISLASRRRLRLQVIQRYGGLCNCCGESTVEFLAVDHVNGDGGEHRRTLKKQFKSGEIKNADLYYWLRTNGFPEGFQVLCHNCNAAKGLYGTCPHRKNPLLLVETMGLGPMVVKSSGAPKRIQ